MLLLLLLPLAVVAAASAFAALLIVQAALSRAALASLPLAPAPHTWLAGHVPSLLVPGFHDVMVAWARGFGGRSYAIATPFGGRALIAADRRTVAAVLGARGRDRAPVPHLPKHRRSYAVLDALWGGAESVFTTADESDRGHWRRTRTLLTGVIGAGPGAKAAAPRGAAAASAMAAQLASAAAKQADGWVTVDAVEAGLRLSMAAITTATLGDGGPGAPLAAVVDVFGPRPPAMAHLHAALEHAQLAMGHPAGELGVWRGAGAAAGRAAVAAHARYVAGLVDALRAGAAPPPPPGSVGDALLTAKPALGRDRLRAEVGMLLTAGFETTGKTLSFAILELAASPRALAAVRAEAAAAGLTPPALPSGADLARLPYTAAVVKETLRLHPVVPGVPRAAPWRGADVPSLGVRLPFGTYVFALLKAVHTDVGEWGDDALDFAPERWLVDGGADHDGTGATVDAPFYPFSTGPRDCPGRFMAAAFATATLAALAVRLDLAAVAGRPGEEHVALTAHAAGEGAMVRVRGRK